jgi:predicted nucleic acid-binding protein
VTTVVDASVAVKWFVAEKHSEKARELLRDPALVAPELIVAEVCNATWRLWRLERLSVEQHAGIGDSIPRLFSRLLPIVPLAPRANAIARALNHPVYDCFYLAVAEGADAELVTDDGRFLSAVQRTEWASRVTALASRT